MTSQTRRRLTIVAAEFNKPLIDVMIAAAGDEIAAAGASLNGVVRVPGAYEVPLVADVHLGRADTDALVVLGYIERGQTLHGEVMGNVVHQALVQSQLKYHKPVGIGIIGPGATAEQAEARKVDYARAAARAALRACDAVEAAGRPWPAER